MSLHRHLVQKNDKLQAKEAYLLLIVPCGELNEVSLACFSFEFDYGLPKPSSLDAILHDIQQLEEWDVVFLPRLLVGQSDCSANCPAVLFEHVLCKLCGRVPVVYVQYATLVFSQSCCID